jgi:dolichol kinase
MSHAPAFARESRDLALELYALLREVDPARWRDEVAQAARARLAEIEARLSELISMTWPNGLGLQSRLMEMYELVREFAPSDVAGDLQQQWEEFRAEIQPRYEALAAALREWDVHLPSLRPTNYKRNLFHASSSVLVIGLVEWVVNTPARMIAISACFFVMAWTLEATRRQSPRLNDFLMGIFAPLAHPHEWHRVNSGTWFITALFALALTGAVEVGVVAVAVLGFADPTAALVGRRWGRTRLLHGRTLEGSLAFVAAGSAVAFGVLTAWHPELGLQAAAAIALAASVSGAVAELLTRRVDDNVAIPLVAGLTAWLTGSALGVF